MSSDNPKLPPKPQTIDPNLEGEWNAPSQSLDTDGKVVGEKPPAPKTSAPAPNAPVQRDERGRPKLEALSTGDLELVRDPSDRHAVYVEPEPYRDEVPTAARSRRAAMVAVLALAVAGALGFFALYKSPRLTSLLGARTPRGAELWLAGTKVGTTPWAVDNRYVGKTPYELRFKGYRPSKGTFMGGEETHLDVEMEKAER
jgi:hypothetical protein